MRKLVSPADRCCPWPWPCILGTWRAEGKGDQGDGKEQEQPRR